MLMRSEYTVGGEYDDGGDWEVSDNGKSIKATLIRKPWFISPLTGRCDVGDSVLVSPSQHKIERWPSGEIWVHPYRNGGLYIFRPIEQAVAS